MNNFLSRILIMLIFFPLLFVVIVIFPFFHHLLFSLLVIAVALLASFEVERMFAKKGIATWRWMSPILAATLPVAAFLEESALIPVGVFGFWLTAVFAVHFILTIWVKKNDELLKRLPLLSSSVFIIFYPSFFLSFLIRLTSFKHAQVVLLLFLSAVFFNDIAAYVAGKLARGKTNLKLLISPNKTLIGFLAGFVFSVGVFLLFSVLFNEFYILPLAPAITMGSIIGLTTIVGDLFESALKRSCQIKDSGVLMGGRGGLMDAIDSLLLSAPVFYYLFLLLARPV